MHLTYQEFVTFFTYLIFLLFHVGGFYLAFNALIKVRTSQGAIAWILALLVLPYVAIPLYLIFGLKRFKGYKRAFKQNKIDVKRYFKHLVPASESKSTESFPPGLKALSSLPITAGNAASLLINGDATFSKIFEAIKAAKSYVLVEFYIIHDDDLGRRFKELLICKANEGVRVYVIYDDIGCAKLKRSYVNELRSKGVETYPFKSTRMKSNRFQINFRNHRKIVVVDGEKAYIGGLNVGDEYMGLNPKIGFWRDTHLEIKGPAVNCVQLAFLEDWQWAVGTAPQLNFPFHQQAEDHQIVVVPTGPADTFESCGLFFLEMINSAKSRLWIATPYFIPDNAVLAGLVLAKLRGVDVRLLTPKNPDHFLVYHAGQNYLEYFSRIGVKVYEYTNGFMHQKVMLIDNDMSVVGSANFDNRSFRLNFEIVAAIASREFNEELHAMLENDFSNSNIIDPESWDLRSNKRKILARVARLFAPVL